MPGFIDRIRNRLKPQPSKPQPTAPVQPTSPLRQPSPPAGTPSRVQMPARPNSQPLNLPASAQPSTPKVDLSLSDPTTPVQNTRPIDPLNPSGSFLGSRTALNIGQAASGGLGLAAGGGLLASATGLLGPTGTAAAIRAQAVLRELVNKGIDIEDARVLAADTTNVASEATIKNLGLLEGTSGDLFIDAAGNLASRASQGIAANTPLTAMQSILASKDAYTTQVLSLSYQSARSAAFRLTSQRMAEIFGLAGREAIDTIKYSTPSMLYHMLSPAQLITGATTVSGVVSITTWGALDNLAGQAATNSKNALYMATTPNQITGKPLMSKKRALEVMEESNRYALHAKAFIDEATTYNPGNWIGGSMYREGVEQYIATIMMNTDAVLNLPDDQEPGDESLSLIEQATEYQLNKRLRELEWRKEDDIAWAKKLEEARKQELDWQAEDNLAFSEGRESERKLDFAEREKTALFFIEQARLRREQQLKWREEDAAYYKLVEEDRLKRREEQMPSKLGFGLL